MTLITGPVQGEHCGWILALSLCSSFFDQFQGKTERGRESEQSTQLNVGNKKSNKINLSEQV